MQALLYLPLGRLLLNREFLVGLNLPPGSFANKSKHICGMDSVPGRFTTNQWICNSWCGYHSWFSSVDPIQDLAVSNYIVRKPPAGGCDLEWKLGVLHCGPVRILFRCWSDPIRVPFKTWSGPIGIRLKFFVSFPQRYIKLSVIVWSEVPVWVTWNHARTLYTFTHVPSKDIFLYWIPFFNVTGK